MKRLLILTMILILNFTITNAQNSGCGLPTCEEPGDPGLTTEKVFSIYPNPGKGNFKVGLNSEMGSKLRVMVLDNNGRMIACQFVQEGDSNQAISFNLKMSKAGMYIVKVISDSSLVSQKIYMVI